MDALSQFTGTVNRRHVLSMMRRAPSRNGNCFFEGERFAGVSAIVMLRGSALIYLDFFVVLHFFVVVHNERKYDGNTENCSSKINTIFTRIFFILDNESENSDTRNHRQNVTENRFRQVHQWLATYPLPTETRRAVRGS